MRYQVNIDFKKGPSYGCVVDATDDKFAVQHALFEARCNGFNQPYKKGQASPAIEEEEGSDA